MPHLNRLTGLEEVANCQPYCLNCMLMTRKGRRVVVDERRDIEREVLATIIFNLLLQVALLLQYHAVPS